jgi:hypothetical protein
MKFSLFVLIVLILGVVNFTSGEAYDARGRLPSRARNQPGQPSNPGPYNPGPYNPGPYNPGPYNPGPYNPGPYYPGLRRSGRLG